MLKKVISVLLSVIFGVVLYNSAFTSELSKKDKQALHILGRDFDICLAGNLDNLKDYTIFNIIRDYSKKRLSAGMPDIPVTLSMHNSNCPKTVAFYILGNKTGITKGAEFGQNFRFFTIIKFASPVQVAAVKDSFKKCLKDSIENEIGPIKTIYKDAVNNFDENSIQVVMNKSNNIAFIYTSGYFDTTTPDNDRPGTDILNMNSMNDSLEKYVSILMPEDLKLLWSKTDKSAILRYCLAFPKTISDDSSNASQVNPDIEVVRNIKSYSEELTPSTYTAKILFANEEYAKEGETCTLLYNFLANHGIIYLKDFIIKDTSSPTLTATVSVQKLKELAKVRENKSK